MKKFLKFSFYGCFLAILSIIVANIIIEKNAEDKLYSSVNDIPKNKVGLLLGTVKYLQNGYINLYYKYRLEATVALFKAKKIDYVIIAQKLTMSLLILKTT